jgi:AcrR family transcriptional regulator
MPRLTREQSQAVTREKLLDAARTVFARDGFSGASIERVADEAGFSKGAVYSNFRSKEDLFLAVLEAPTLVDLPELLSVINTAADSAEVVDILADWANKQARSGGWALLVLDHVRRARQNNSFGEREARLFRNIWTTLGNALVAKLPVHFQSVDPETLGAMVCELAYAPSMGFSAGPTAGGLVRLALKGLIPDRTKARKQ